MKAIVVRQPWATLIALGVKQIETRPFPPNGPIPCKGRQGVFELPAEIAEVLS